MYTFDGPNKLIILQAGVTSFDAKDLYSRWKDWMLLSDNSKYLPAFELSVGGNALGAGSSLGSYFFITNGWKIRPQEADHILTADGNLFSVPDTAGVFTPTLGNFNVEIIRQVSSLTQSVNTSGSDPSAVAQAVWDYLSTNPTQVDSMKEIVETIETLSRLIPAAL